MQSAIRQHLTVVSDGRLEVRSPALRAGLRAEVIVIVESPAASPGAASDSQAAWDRLCRHAGAVDSGNAHSSDNVQIDADLAREFGGDVKGTPT